MRGALEVCRKADGVGWCDVDGGTLPESRWLCGLMFSSYYSSDGMLYCLLALCESTDETVPAQRSRTAAA